MYKNSLTVQFKSVCLIYVLCTEMESFEKGDLVDIRGLLSGGSLSSKTTSLRQGEHQRGPMSTLLSPQTPHRPSPCHTEGLDSLLLTECLAGAEENLRPIHP